MMFLIGSVPTILGGGIGYVYNSNVLDVLFNGIAIGTILYVILPMFRILFREPREEPTQVVAIIPQGSKEKHGHTLVHALTQRAIYLGIFIGFALGWIVNLV